MIKTPNNTPNSEYPRLKISKDGKEMQITFELHYSYYQHNSGLSDNGGYCQKIEYRTLEEARHDACRIQFCIDNKESEDAIIQDMIRKIEDNFISYSGYFTRQPIIYKITREKLAKPLDDIE